MYIVKTIENYYLKDDGNTIAATLNPYAASSFATKEDAEIFSKYSGEECGIVVDSLAEYRKFNIWVENGMRVGISWPKYSMEYDCYNGESKEEIIKFHAFKLQNRVPKRIEETWPYLLSATNNYIIDMIPIFNNGNLVINEFGCTVKFAAATSSEDLEKEINFVTMVLGQKLKELKIYVGDFSSHIVSVKLVDGTYLLSYGENIPVKGNCLEFTFLMGCLDYIKSEFLKK
jgi:hypothetical protein